MKLTTAVMLAAIAFSGTAHAQHTHDPGKIERGRNGGQVVETGDYHVEMVSNDGVLDVYISDHDNKPLETTGYKAVAILSLGGKSTRIAMDAADGSRLTGKAGGALPAKPKGVVQITSPAGKTVQAKFN